MAGWCLRPLIQMEILEKDGEAEKALSCSSKLFFSWHECDVLELVGQEPAVLLPQQMCLSGSLEGCVWAVCPSVHGIWGAFTFLCIHITGEKSKQSSLRSMLSQAQKMLSGNSDVPLSKSGLWEAVGQFSFCSDCSKLS